VLIQPRLWVDLALKELLALLGELGAALQHRPVKAILDGVLADLRPPMERREHAHEGELLGGVAPDSMHRVAGDQGVGLVGDDAGEACRPADGEGLGQAAQTSGDRSESAEGDAAGGGLSDAAAGLVFRSDLSAGELQAPEGGSRHDARLGHAGERACGGCGRRATRERAREQERRIEEVGGQPGDGAELARASQCAAALHRIEQHAADPHGVVVALGLREHGPEVFGDPAAVVLEVIGGEAPVGVGLCLELAGHPVANVGGKARIEGGLERAADALVRGIHRLALRERFLGARVLGGLDLCDVWHGGGVVRDRRLRRSPCCRSRA
jgi:hypothetical protein